MMGITFQKTRHGYRPTRRCFYIALCLITPIFLSGCDALTGPGGWFGDKSVPPLPGERISVLSLSQDLSTDVEAKDVDILLPRPVVNPNWPQSGGYANNAMHHLAVRDQLGEAWSNDIGEGADDELRINASPVIANGVIYAVDAETVVTAFRTDNGREIWSIDLKPEDEEDDGHIPGGLAYGDGKLFVTTGFNRIFALDAKSGSVLWTYTAESPFRSAPTFRGGRVFAISLTNSLYALNSFTGEVLWDYQALSEPASLLGGSGPAVDQGVVVAPFTSGEVIAFRVNNGRQLWADSLVSASRTDVVSSLSHVRGRPVIDRGLVFAVSHSGIMVAIELRSGRRVWTRDIGGIDSIWVAGDYLFSMNLLGEILALSRTDGKILWVTALPRWEDEEDKEDLILWTGPVLVSDRLIVAGSQGEAYAISPYNGRILGALEMPDRVNVSPVVADGTVYFISDNADLTAYR